MRLNAQHGGKLFAGSKSTSRKVVVSVARLRNPEPDLFEEVECLAWRLDAAAEALEELRA